MIISGLSYFILSVLAEFAFTLACGLKYGENGKNNHFSGLIF